MKKPIIILIVALTIAPIIAQHCGSCPTGTTVLEASTNTTKTPVIKKAGTPHWINDNYYITYEWNKAPKIGDRILMVSAFDRNKKPVTNLKLTANAYMPSMRGAHDTGDTPMQLNRKNKYAIPVNFMMLGDWEIELKINQDKRLLGKALIRIDI